ncbi:RNA-directed DNA polymerase, eukaryota, reverse transcriptase zinc-binding domain protein [Tanacetum coccineum]|uniref:RNA-directed DNA polymerase, eukaryota, reverse transcriptase zinc-binding domain protein n=1 Tax=Tanacetum coccineum TaxID=301880 RepID=A0ABQ5GSZ0_9ASTR
MKSGLIKLVNVNQSAFIPRIFFQDIILITQELLRGYNRKNGQNRCAMKIDVQNAYDTVNWDFLSENLKKFGFHSKMVHWIMTCVFSCGYSICINGDRYRYFKGGKGLRQCDSISPYLFNLVIQKNVLESHSFKYHQSCKDMMLTHLCFVGDLLVLCHGDSGYVEVVKKSLDDFSLVSGLHPNMNKSTIFFRILNEGERARILNSLEKKGKAKA